MQNTQSKKNRDAKTGVPSGFTDMLPLEKSRFNALIQKISEVVEKYDFTPIETPTVEWLDTLKGQDDTGGKLIYTVQNGYDTEKEPNKGLRFDLTLPLARYCVDHAHQLPMPFRRYHQGKVFRGETAQTGKGRYREFDQFDADIVGSSGSVSDAEIAAMLIDGMRALNLPATVYINNRLILDGLLEVAQSTGIDTSPGSHLCQDILRLIDKLDKIGAAGVLNEITKLTGDAPAAHALFEKYLSLSEKPSSTKNDSTSAQFEQTTQAINALIGASAATQQGLTEIRSVYTLLSKSGYANHILFAPQIVRGLGYYTGIIYETFITGYEKYGSVASGGRYDNLIADLGGPNVPAVGASFGISRLLDILTAMKWQAGAKTPAQVCIVHFSESLTEFYFSLATKLRSQGIRTHLYHHPKKMGQQLSYAGELGIPFAIIIGDDEYAQKTALIRNLQTREQQTVAQDQLSVTIAQLVQ